MVPRRSDKPRFALMPFAGLSHFSFSLALTQAEIARSHLILGFVSQRPKDTNKFIIWAGNISFVRCRLSLQSSGVIDRIRLKIRSERRFAKRKYSRYIYLMRKNSSLLYCNDTTQSGHVTTYAARLRQKKIDFMIHKVI